ncbi:MAG: 4-(cytidine 5'-diphospho)-2-C-methyl-D-erythritol kinase [Planctomycetes bacterium]|nr:4-(cytidine 5'-diphospho)-2-C-methyl-D-erythritol kinase [Planctomycetota bacterium]
MSVASVLEKKKQKVLLTSPAKVNLFLEITGKRNDGYHNVVTVMHAIDLYDTMSIEFSRSTKVINRTGKDPLNLIARTISEVELYTNQKINVLVKVEKNIPIGSGLGSGASNAAAVIKGIDELYDLRLTNTDRKRLASVIGSDVTFFLQSKAAICKGRGDLVKDFVIKNEIEYLLLVPEIRLITKDVYNALKRDQLSQKRSPVAILNGLKKGDINFARDSMFNRLWFPAIALYPDLARIKEIAEMHGLQGFQMTGSGSAMFYPYVADENAEGKIKEFENSLRKTKIKFSIFRCKGLN